MKVKEIRATKPSKVVKGVKLEQQRVAAYCRVSTDGEEQLNSYESQKRYYTEFIQKKKEWHFVGVYADAAITGTKIDKRVDFQRLINDCLNQEIDMVITKSISRFARNTYDTLKYVRMLKEKNVAIFFEEENINTMTMDGELLLTILSSVAQQEVENISMNVKKGLKMKMKRGEMIGFQGCVGYDYNKTDKTLNVNEAEAETVRLIFELYLNGFGANVISKELNDKGIKTKRGNLWTSSTVIGVIKNEKYMGDLLMGKTFTVDPISKRRLTNHGEEDKYYIKDHHQPIIDRDTFEKVQEILSKRSYSRQPKGSNVTREKYSRKYAFSSMLECGFCEGNLTRRAWHTNSQYKKIIWQCKTNTKQGKKYCEHSKAVPEEIIELAFLESYAILSGQDRELVDSFIERIEKTLGVKTISKKINQFERELLSVDKKKKKLLNLMLEDGIEKELFDSSMTEMGEGERKLRKKVDELEIQLEHEKELNKRINAFKKVLSGDVKLEKFDRYIFENLIEKVIVGSTDEDGNVDPYNITFIYKTGLDNSINGSKFRRDGRKKKSNVLPLNNSNKVSVMSTNCSDNTRGDGSKTTTQKPLILLGFKVFLDFFTFTKNSDNYVEKHLKNGIEIEIAI